MMKFKHFYSEFKDFYNFSVGLYVIPDNLIDYGELQTFTKEVSWVFEHFKNCWFVGPLRFVVNDWEDFLED